MFAAFPSLCWEGLMVLITTGFLSCARETIKQEELIKSCNLKTTQRGILQDVFSIITVTNNII